MSMGPFGNPDYNNPATKFVPDDRWGGSTYWGGMGAPDGPGHGHAAPGMTPRPPVADFLGNAALNGVQTDFPRPRW
jgi:hypothetical protein